MDNEQILDEKLLMFIRNELSGEEQVQVQEQMQADANLRARDEHLLVAQALIWDAGREQEAEELKALYVEEQAATIRRPLFRCMAIAAVIIALLAAGFFISRPQAQSMESLYASNYERPKGGEQLAAAQDLTEVLDSLAKYAGIAYNEGDMAEADRLYAILDTTAGAEALQDYHLLWGIAQLETGKAQDAFKTFGSMRSNFESRDWYQALALLKLKDKEATVAALEKILEDPEHFYFGKAKELLGQLGE
jgi:hypothetical protein